MKHSEQRYTCEEILKMLSESSLDDEFKGQVGTIINATLQAAYNAVHHPDTTMSMDNTYGDRWVNEHNRIVALYQQYHN